MTYTLQDFLNITFDGFDFKLSDETIKHIQELSTQVGSPSYIKTPIFQKRDRTKDDTSIRRKRSNKSMDNLNNDLDSARTFHTTKLEKKVGLAAEIDVIRLHLNKMTDKSYSQIKSSIIDILEENISEEDMMQVGTIIFDIASNNRFFSKLYADLYSDLVNKYEIMFEIFNKNFVNFLELFNVVEYVDPDVDYNKYCQVNKDNEKRRSLSSFFVNLVKNEVLKPEQLAELTQKMVSQVLVLMKEENNKSQVDEYTENIFLLYDERIFSKMDENNYLVENKTISDTIKFLASCKVKTFPSLSNKSIFKYMDIIDA